MYDPQIATIEFYQTRSAVSRERSKFFLLASDIPFMLYCAKPLKKSKYVLPLSTKRAADGGIAAHHVKRNGLLRANRTRSGFRAGKEHQPVDLHRSVGETEQTLR